MTNTWILIPYEFKFKSRTILGIDLCGFMKLFNHCNVLPRYLTAFNYVGLNLNKSPTEIKQYPIEY